ncbi:MAG TPA: DUF4337 family protein [Dehalococcoidia bacterium]|nr:DUF4337 family protein [Dehalococcoidia bacterium]
MVEAKEAAEVIREVAGGNLDGAPERHPLHKIVALLVAVLAGLLAVATISTGAATRRLLNDNIHLNDLHATADVGEVRQSNAAVSADLLQSILDTSNPAAAARAAIEQKIGSYRSTAADLEGDAAKGTGLKSLETQIGDYEGLEETTETQIMSFEYSEVALQIGIVLASLAILVTSRAVFYAASALGALGLLLTLNGFFLLAHLPSVH